MFGEMVFHVKTMASSSMGLLVGLRCIYEDEESRGGLGNTPLRSPSKGLAVGTQLTELLLSPLLGNHYGCRSEAIHPTGYSQPMVEQGAVPTARPFRPNAWSLYR